LDQDLWALEPLDAPGEQEMELAWGDGAGGAGAIAESRREGGEVNARGSGVDAV
jgi:hypothetical protein